MIKKIILSILFFFLGSLSAQTTGPTKIPADKSIKNQADFSGKAGTNDSTKVQSIVPVKTETNNPVHSEAMPVNVVPVVPAAVGETPDAPPQNIPYFGISISEGAILIDGANLSSANSLVMDTGYLRKLDSKSSLLAIYELMYQGPGLRAQDSESLSERSQDHFIVVKYLTKAMPKLDVKVKANFMNEFYKLSKSESWGGGLYDFYKYGGGGEVVLHYLKTAVINASYELNYLQFPNYTDLLSDYLSGVGGDSTLKQTQLLHQIRVSIANANKSAVNYFGDYAFTLKAFLKKGIVLSDGVYSDSAFQSDTDQRIKIGGDRAFGWFILGVSAEGELYRSNLFYLYQDSAGQKLPVNFNFENYTGTLSTGFKLTEKNSIVLAGSYGYKNYPNRNIQDEQGRFVTGKNLKSNMILATVSLNIAARYFIQFQPVYTFKLVTANDKSATGAAFNYNAHYLGFNLIVKY